MTMIANKTALFERLNYYFGQKLGVSDFETEQSYFHERGKLHNRCLHGSGVVSGMWVKPHPGGTDGKVVVSRGLALDQAGNELMLPEDLVVDVFRLLDPKILAEWKAFQKQWADNKATPGWIESYESKRPRVFLVLRHNEVRCSPRRPVTIDDCNLPYPVEFGRIRDAVCPEVWTTAPGDVDCSHNCIDQPENAGVVVACIALPGEGALTAKDINTAVRRTIGTYPYNRVTSINWIQGAEYDAAHADQLLRHGLQIHFHRPVQQEPLDNGEKELFGQGVIDVIQCRMDTIDEMERLPIMVHRPSGNKMLSYLKIEVTSSKLRLDERTRVQVVLRGAFLLDECCRPLDAAHVGGWVPYHGAAGEPGEHGKPRVKPTAKCKAARGEDGPWWSGAGSPGGNFESWFFVK